MGHQVTPWVQQVKGHMRRTCRRREDGATLVEFALVMPLLLLLFIGIMEFGTAFYDFLTVEQAAREGVRTGAFLGTTPGADCEIVLAIVDFLPGGFLDRMGDIQIYEADANGDQNSFLTNVWHYKGGGLDPLDCDNWIATEPWPATSRQTVSGSLPLDIIGVRLQMTHKWITGFPPFKGSYVIDESSIVRMEPEAFG
jgi:hypothetical protein